MKKFRAKKKDMILIATALPTAMLTLIPWSLRQKKHSKRRNKYLRKKAREFNEKYGPKLKMIWSIEQQRMTITRTEIKAKVIKDKKLHTKVIGAREVNNGKKEALSKGEILNKKPKQPIQTDHIDPFVDYLTAD